MLTVHRQSIDPLARTVSKVQQQSSEESFSQAGLTSTTKLNSSMVQDGESAPMAKPHILEGEISREA